MISGHDFQQKMANTVPSQEQHLNASSNLSTQTEGMSSLDLLALRAGDQKHTKSAISSALVDIAEKDGKQLKEEQKALIRNFVDMNTKGFVASMSMKCEGKKCPFLSACVLNKVGATLPIGQPCPLEQTIIVTWVTKHLKALGIEDIDDPAHSFDMDMLYELAGQELIRWRCSVHLSDDPRLVSNKMVGGTMHGEPIFADVINPVLQVMESAGKNISSIRNALVATRESQLKAGQSSTDPTQLSAERRETAHKIAMGRRKELEERRAKSEKLIDADFEVKDE
jgi:hypothetical protein